MDYQTPLEVVTGPAPAACLIWLHGLGANGYDFLPIVDELELAALPALRFIFPHAPDRPVTLNNGHVMPAWYDLAGLDTDAPEDERGIRASIAYINQLIEQEIARGIPAKRIALAGFSQGGNIALNCALRYPLALAGAMILSSYLGLSHKLEQERSTSNADMPIFIAHGTQDNVVPLHLAEHMRHMLQKLHYPVEWQTYPMAHTVCADEVLAIGYWLTRVLTKPGTC